MLRWIGLAVLGILVAAAISIAASRLASQQIGLDSQPISAGDALAPPGRRQEVPRQPAHLHAGRRQTHQPPPTNATPEPPQQSVPASPESTLPPPTPPDDSGGSGGGEHSGGSADD
jgi:hypothetical protein